MSWWRRILGIEQKLTSRDLDEMLRGGGETKAGINVTRERALQVSAVLACVRVLAEGVAQVPFRVYQREGEEIRRASDHPLDRLIYRKPNDYQTAFEFRETQMIHCVLEGNAYAFVNKVGIRREPRELKLIEPARVTPLRENDVITYRVTGDDGAQQIFPAEAIWHLRGPSWDTWRGMSAMKLAKEAMGLSIALEQSHASMHGHGGDPGGVYTVQDQLSAEQYEFLSKWLDRYAAGGDRQGKPMILDRGAKWESQELRGVDAQHVETRRHQIEEIARMFRIMPLMLGHPADMAARAATESIFIQHVVHTLMPWYQRIEQSADLALLSEEDVAQGFYTKFTPNALMRGAAKDRAEFYTKALGAGGHGTAWMTKNEVRGLEDLPRDSDPASDALNTGQPQEAAQ